MTRGSKLDRANSSKLQSGSGLPDANTRGNVWMDEDTGRIYRKTGAGVWVSDYLSSSNVLCIFAQTESVSVDNTDVETSLIGDGIGSATLDPGELVVGSTVEISAYGTYVYSDQVPSTLTLRVKLEGAELSYATFPVDVTTGQNDGVLGWSLNYMITISESGERSDLAWCQGICFAPQSDGSMYGRDLRNNTRVSIDTTISNAVDITARWSQADDEHIFTCTNLVIKLLG